MVAESFDRAPEARLTLMQEIPTEVLTYLLPSRYCEPEYFYDMTVDVNQDELSGYDQVVSITNGVKQSIAFSPGSSDQPISAIQVNIRQYGVCRDLSHLAIAMCRSISISARMVVGYLYGLQSMGLHAWFEVYVGGRWYGLILLK
ncbi:MAG: transglutaminase-like putative cysteine protease [Cellvibrionaceae bacterium]|jgi:transglutaminase-like putative cysteine protease